MRVYNHSVGAGFAPASGRTILYTRRWRFCVWRYRSCQRQVPGDFAKTGQGVGRFASICDRGSRRRIRDQAVSGSGESFVCGTPEESKSLGTGAQRTPGVGLYFVRWPGAGLGRAEKGPQACASPSPSPPRGRGSSGTSQWRQPSLGVTRRLGSVSPSVLSAVEYRISRLLGIRSGNLR